MLNEVYNYAPCHMNKYPRPSIPHAQHKPGDEVTSVTTPASFIAVSLLYCSAFSSCARTGTSPAESREASFLAEACRKERETG